MSKLFRFSLIFVALCSLSICGSALAQDVTGDNLNLTEADNATIATINADDLIFNIDDEIPFILSQFQALFLDADIRTQGPAPALILDDTDANGEIWIFESEQDFLEIGTAAAGNGDGAFKILDSAKEDALTLTDNGITINGDTTESELTVFGQGIGDEQVVVQFHPDANKESTLQLGVNTGDDAFIVRSSGTNGGGFNSLIRADLDAPEDSLTVLESGTVRVGVPFGDTEDPSFSLHSAKGLLIGDLDEKYGFFRPTPVNNNGFSVRDRDNQTDPLFIHNDTDNFGIVIGGLFDNSNDVGMGIFEPEASLHIARNDGSAQLLIEESNATEEFRTMAKIVNNGASKIEMTNTETGRTWAMVADFNDQFQIRQTGPNTANFAIRGDGTFSFNNLGQSVMAIRPNGDVRIGGVLTEGSDRNIKENIERVDSTKILTKVVDLPLSTWNYIADENDTQHLGPMAQDFHAAFGLGNDEKKIATLDTSGVALAAIQGLNEKLETEIKQRDAKIAALKEANEDLAARMQQLEAMVQAMSSK